MPCILRDFSVFSGDILHDPATCAILHSGKNPVNPVLGENVLFCDVFQQLNVQHFLTLVMLVIILASKDIHQFTQTQRNRQKKDNTWTRNPRIVFFFSNDKCQMLPQTVSIFLPVTMKRVYWHFIPCCNVLCITSWTIMVQHIHTSIILWKITRDIHIK